MKTLLEDYQRKLKTINEMIENNTNNGTIEDMLREERYLTKRAEYNAFIVDIERAIKREEEAFKEKCSGGFVQTTTKYAISKQVRKYSPTPIVEINDLGFEEIVMVATGKKDKGNTLSIKIVNILNNNN